MIHHHEHQGTYYGEIITFKRLGERGGEVVVGQEHEMTEYDYLVVRPGSGKVPGGKDREKPNIPPKGGGSSDSDPTEADMQAAQYAVQVGHENMVIAEGQRSAAYDYLQQARAYSQTCLAQKEAAEQRVRNTEVKLDALIAKTNREMAETDDWLAGRT